LLELPKALNADWAPFTWHFYQAQDGKPTVFINDGNDLLSLAKYVIEADGSVQPSVLCPTCGFHDDVKLKDWEK
jgi:hypothetical protein